MEDKIDKLREENKRLRKLLWLRHGCELAALYGDDGRMNCNRCLIDFKAQSADEIEQLWWRMAQAAALAQPAPAAPTHGPCCTCQRCGHDYDSCRCDLDDVADRER